MDAKTLEALKASIAKWERNAEARSPDAVRFDLADCPLCQVFHPYFGGPDCAGCPVNDAGHWRCGGSPYDAVDGAINAWMGGGGKVAAANFRPLPQE